MSARKRTCNTGWPFNMLDGFALNLYRLTRTDLWNKCRLNSNESLMRQIAEPGAMAYKPCLLGCVFLFGKFWRPIRVNAPSPGTAGVWSGHQCSNSLSSHFIGASGLAARDGSDTQKSSPTTTKTHRRERVGRWRRTDVIFSQTDNGSKSITVGKAFNNLRNRSDAEC